MRDNCPLCRGTKDKRAVYCLPCRRVVTPSIRRGGVKTDNRLTNLRLMDGREHHREHMLEGGFAKRMSKLGHAARWGV